MLNRIILIGRLTRDPELRYTPNKGTAVTNFTLAVDSRFTNQQGERHTDFINVVVWGKQAENCASYLNKGRLVAVEGRLQVRSYEDSQGTRKKAVEVVADSVQFLERAPGAAEKKYEDFPGEEADINEDDLPF